MLTYESLIKGGYKPFKQDNLKEFTKDFLQKCITDGLGKRYYITLAVYENSKYITKGMSLPEFSFSPDVQFTTPAGTTFNVEMLTSATDSVESVERFFEKLWCALECTYYEKYYYEEPNEN